MKNEGNTLVLTKRLENPDTRLNRLDLRSESDMVIEGNPTVWKNDYQVHQSPNLEFEVANITGDVWFLLFQTFKAEIYDDVTRLARPVDLLRAGKGGEQIGTTTLCASQELLRERIFWGQSVLSAKQTPKEKVSTSDQAEFVWSNALYEARKAAQEFSKDLATPASKKPGPAYIACEEDRPVPLEVEYQEPLNLLDPDEDVLEPRTT